MDEARMSTLSNSASVQLSKIIHIHSSVVLIAIFLSSSTFRQYCGSACSEESKSQPGF